MTAQNTLYQALARMPLVAILGGLEPERATDVAKVLVEAGFTIIEVPLTAPDPFASIAAIAESVPENVLVGAGAVLEPSEIWDLEDAGGHLVVTPNTDPRVISAVREKNLYALSGVATPTEAFAALEAGAHALKLFPAQLTPPAVLAAMLAVLPRGTLMLPGGGITPDAMAAYWQAGARGFGVGAALFQPGKTLADIKTDAEAFVAIAQTLMEA